MVQGKIWMDTEDNLLNSMDICIQNHQLVFQTIMFKMIMNKIYLNYSSIKTNPLKLRMKDMFPI